MYKASIAALVCPFAPFLLPHRTAALLAQRYLPRKTFDARCLYSTLPAGQKFRITKYAKVDRDTASRRRTQARLDVG